MENYLIEIENKNRGCIDCPYCYYNDGDYGDEGFHCLKHHKYIGEYDTENTLIAIPNWCTSIKRIDSFVLKVLDLSKQFDKNNYNDKISGHFDSDKEYEQMKLKFIVENMK